MIPPTLTAKLTSIFLAALIVLLSPGCAPTAIQQQALVASAVAAVANVSLDALGQLYERDLTDAITAAAHGETAAATTQHRTPCPKCAMDQAEAEVNARWIAVWGDPSSSTRFGAWETFRTLHDAWANQIEAGQSNSPLGDRVNTAYCDLLTALPSKYRAAITVAAVSCPAPVEVIR